MHICIMSVAMIQSSAAVVHDAAASLAQYKNPYHLEKASQLCAPVHTAVM